VACNNEARAAQRRRGCVCHSGAGVAVPLRGRRRAARLVSGCGALTEDQRQGHLHSWPGWPYWSQRRLGCALGARPGIHHLVATPRRKALPVTVHRPPADHGLRRLVRGAFTTGTEVSHVVLVASNDAQRHSSCAAAADAAGGGWRATTRRARLSGGAAACATAARAWRCHCAGRHRAVRLVSGCGALTEDQRQGH
jgi:hypothetical protein